MVDGLEARGGHAHAPEQRRTLPAAGTLERKNIVLRDILSLVGWGKMFGSFLHGVFEKYPSLFVNFRLK